MATLQATFELPPHREAPRTARRLLETLLLAWAVDEDLGADARLVASELVANAVDHAARPGAGEITLVLDITAAEDWIELGLADGSSIRPVVRQLDVAAERGRGMQLVAGLAQRWGCHDLHGGKRVWCQLTTGPTPVEPTRTDTPAEPPARRLQP